MRLSPQQLVLAVLAPLAALAARWALNPLLHEQAPLQLFTVAVVVVAWRGGFAAGLMSTIVGALLGVFVFISPPDALRMPTLSEITRLSIYVINGLCISAIAESTQRALRREREARATAGESEARLSAVFQQAGAGIAQTDLSGGFLMVNDRYCEMVGRSREELLRQRLEDITHPDDLPRSTPLFHAVTRQGQPFAIEKRYVRPDGAPVWVRKSVAPIRSSGGAVESVLVVIQDVTEGKQAEEAMRASEEQLRLVTDHASIYLSQCDAAHRFKFVNRPYAARFGLEPSEIVGRHVSEIVGEAAYQIIRPHMDATLTGQQVEFETQLPYAGLGLRWVRVAYAPEHSATGEVVGFVGVITDIGQRKRAEQELERARDEALAASRAKDEFLASLSHELRTPLNPVLMLASELERSPDVPPHLQQDFQLIRKNVELEARLIDDLLDLTRIVRGKLQLNFETLDAHNVLEEAIHIVRNDIAERRQRLTQDFTAPRCFVRGDAVRLQQVLWNVLKNAVKFTPEDGVIAVHTTCVGDASALRISVVDSGIGIEPDEMPRIFNAFDQGRHQQSHRFGGLGLGLAICKPLIENHGGRIWAESAGRNHGSVFHIELPITAEMAPVVPARRPASDRFDETGLRRVLLVEDHEPTRATLVRLLSRHGFEVVEAGTIARARELATRGTFDFVVSDLGLPDGEGCTLMAELRAQYGLRGVALSGFGMDDDIQRSLASGFVAHLTKPVNIETLLRVFEEGITARVQR